MTKPYKVGVTAHLELTVGVGMNEEIPDVAIQKVEQVLADNGITVKRIWWEYFREDRTYETAISASAEF